MGSLTKLISITKTAVDNAFINSRGPVHLNFPFQKPFEPKTYTDEIDEKSYRKVFRFDTTTTQAKLKKNALSNKLITSIANRINKKEKGLIVVGPLEHYYEHGSYLMKLSKVTGFPFLGDSCSQIRFGNYSKNIITTYDSFLRYEQIIEDLKPEVILHFGRTSTSKVLDEFTGSKECERYVINEFGDVFDTGKNTKKIIKESPVEFISKLIEELNKKKYLRKKNSYLDKFKNLDAQFSNKKNQVLKNEKKINSISLIDSCVKLLPSESNIFLSNSMPIRDFDAFSGIAKKKLNVFFNRGASGIDGIIASACGVTTSQNKPTLLLIGDLAFQHDLSSLFLSQFINSPLIIVLINNNGGGIFYNLPISKYGRLFEEYFVTPQNRDFSSLVKGFGVKYYRIVSVKEFEQRFTACLKKKEVSVIEIKVDENESINLRKKIREID
jgi:2-succinyl-5-enolpyruvyl-6-hydroxy-3-cyclohexene-1-carboxylate synthase